MEQLMISLDCYKNIKNVEHIGSLIIKLSRLITANYKVLIVRRNKTEKNVYLLFRSRAEFYNFASRYFSTFLHSNLKTNDQRN